MSNTTYPAAIDSPAYYPTTSDTLASASHHTLHGFANDAILALETKLGAGASVASTGAILVGTGANASAWSTTLTNPSITTSLVDANNKTWIGQTAAGASAVNYINVANATTTNAPTISALGTDSNISLNLVPKGSGKVQDNGTNLIDFRSSFNNFVSSGGIWVQNSGLVGSMTLATVWINGVEYTVGTVSNHTFGTSVDTYVDYTVGTGVTYTAVANGASSGFTLAANSVRLAKVVTSGAAITSITQTGNTDALTNPIRPGGPVASTAVTLIAQTNNVATTETTASASFTNIATPGPLVTVNIGQNGAALVVLSAGLSNNTGAAYAVMGYAVSGANTIAANFLNSLANQTPGGVSSVNEIFASYVQLLTGLTPGVTTFTAKYEIITAGTATFRNRYITVIPQ